MRMECERSGLNPMSRKVGFHIPMLGRPKHSIISLFSYGTDFDVSLRLQVGGYITRWATYSAGGFKEGVSLTINDEMYGMNSSSSTRRENADAFCTAVDGKNTLTGVANSYSAPFDTGTEDRFHLSSRDSSGLLSHSIARSAFYPMSSATTRLRVDSP
jgi:hypothetical protein